MIIDQRWENDDDLGVIGPLVKDLLRHQGAQRNPGRGGKQPAPTPAALRQFLQRLAVLDRAATQPFHLELRELSGHPEGATVDHVARACNLGRTRAWQLLNDCLPGGRGPTMAEMEAAAAAYGRDPHHFVEYRAQLLADYTRDWMIAHPERSLDLVRLISR